MFGYIQPLKCELKIKEYDYYRAAYCGLCNALRTRCGIKARFIVNYDFVFLAMLLSATGQAGEKTQKRRCIACPRGRMCVLSEKYDIAADASVILTYLKLCDDLTDATSFFTRLKARVLTNRLSSIYRKACARMPEYASSAKQLFQELCALESKKTASVDETADKFALMLSSVVEGSSSESRILKEIFYHIGRFIYIIDALDDFEDDMKKGEYNPIAERFGVKEEKTLSEEIKNEVLITLEDSRTAVERAFELLNCGSTEGILKNIISLGMKRTIYQVITKEKERKR